MDLSIIIKKLSTSTNEYCLAWNSSMSESKALPQNDVQNAYTIMVNPYNIIANDIIFVSVRCGNIDIKIKLIMRYIEYINNIQFHVFEQPGSGQTIRSNTQYLNELITNAMIRVIHSSNNASYDLVRLLREIETSNDMQCFIPVDAPNIDTNGTRYHADFIERVIDINNGNHVFVSVQCDNQQLFVNLIFLYMRKINSKPVFFFQDSNKRIITTTYEILHSLIYSKRLVKRNHISISHDVDRCLTTNTVYVFDFDCTITFRHFFAFLNNLDVFKGMYSKSHVIDNEEVDLIYNTVYGYFKNTEQTKIADDIVNKFINLIFGSKDRLDNIKYLINTLQSTRQCVYIASKGIRDEIIKCIELVGINIALTNITGRDDRNKVDVLQLLYSNNNVFYVDDDDDQHQLFAQNINAPYRVKDLYVHKKNTYVFMPLFKNGYGLVNHNMITILQLNLNTISESDHIKLQTGLS